MLVTVPLSGLHNASPVCESSGSTSLVISGEEASVKVSPLTEYVVPLGIFSIASGWFLQPVALKVIVYVAVVQLANKISEQLSASPALIPTVYASSLNFHLCSSEKSSEKYQPPKPNPSFVGSVGSVILFPYFTDCEATELPSFESKVTVQTPDSSALTTLF